MENNSEDENSDNGLQIVIESPKPKKRSKKTLDETDKRIIETVEKDLEENLEEKAAKANLTAKHVKNIIKEVVTNEHVLALVRHAENPNNSDEPITVYEPKYTRAKTKQLLSTNVQQKFLPWVTPVKPVSEVQRLFTEELQEDSSGDEYVPESPSKNSSFDSQLDTSHCTIKNDEGANIALRTRSKLCLSHTPLEVIEEAFMPPDITTDMYDMDCDDDVWKEFLKTFTRPLDEVTKAAEDEDHDPEYNVLADEEIDKVDREELRADRAVTVSRKELNRLMAELFEFADIYESNKLTEKNAASNNLPLDQSGEGVENENSSHSDSDNDPNISIKKYQISILTQQIRQHVQMLTQSFLLSYEHPEFSDQAFKYKEMLNEMVAETKIKDNSVYDVINLKPAMNLISGWEKLFMSGNEEVRECIRYVDKVISESIEARLSGREYIVTFPPLLMKTVSSSDVFIYPNLLPRIPFKSLHVRGSYKFFTRGEENLIALFLEQALPYLRQDPFYLTYQKKINMERVCQLMSQILIPNVRSTKLVRHIRNRKHPSSDENPIQFLYRTKKAPPSVHYVAPMDAESVLPPCKQKPELLPYLWRKFIYPDEKNESRFISDQSYSGINNRVVYLSYPFIQPVIQAVPQPNINFSKPTTGNRRILPKTLLPIVACTRKTKHTTARRKKLLKGYSKENNNNISSTGGVSKLQSTMLPDMPSLGNTPLKNDNSQTDGTSVKDNTNVDGKKEESLSFKNIASYFHAYDPNNLNKARRNFEGISEFRNGANQTDPSQTDSSYSSVPNSTEKDNPDDINELMKASATVKNVTKKKPSGAEKKRTKVRREFVSNLMMATPDDLQTQNKKEEFFADAFFDKLRETLTVADFDKMVRILGHYDESRGEFLQLFKNVQSILFPKYVELAEEFYLFLTKIQAQKIGQLMPYFLIKDMDRFIKKLHVYFKDQPSQLKKIIKCITDLSENPDITMDIIKTTVIPLFKGNAALTDWFLQIFPCERPPKMLTSAPYEAIDISKELARQPGEDICETVTFPDTDDPYGGSNCICPCHNVENVQFKSRSHHCKQCGLKFIQGKIYIQTGKGLRPAVVSFLTNSEKDHSKRLAAAERKRTEVSPNKQVTSPCKENHTNEELQNSNESEDDENKKKNQKTKTPRKRKIKDGSKPNVKESKKSVSKTCGKIKSETAKGAKSSPKRQSKKRPITKKTPETKPGSSLGQQKRPAEEQEIEYSEPPEHAELKVSSDHSGESGSEFFESSQDITNTDEDSDDLANVQLTRQNASWTREEDKIILQAFRQSNNNEETFKQISKVLQNRSVVEIKSRFHKLMSLLQEMAANSNS
ncbi:uncharacterized protein LOC135134483 isoform X2 [Zophobas morio]|uniref:uncharacterized protein LOC135134483 isoform X2 n=1 Tax=Zophobas morio TaxID=2755281 RepID=UPI003083B323